MAYSVLITQTSARIQKSYRAPNYMRLLLLDAHRVRTISWNTFRPVNMRDSRKGRGMSSAPRDLGPRADVVVEQTHFELLQLRELLQGSGHVPCAFIAWATQEGRRGDLKLSGVVQPSLLWYTYCTRNKLQYDEIKRIHQRDITRVKVWSLAGIMKVSHTFAAGSKHTHFPLKQE